MQFLEVNGLDQVKIEAGLFRTLHVLLCAEAGERNGLDVSVGARLCGDFVTTSVGQADVAQYRVDVVRAYDVDCSLHIICSHNIMTEMGKQTR